MSDPNASQPLDPATPPAAASAPTPPPAAAPTPPPAAAQPAQPQYAAAPAGPYTPDTDRQLAMWAHIGGVVGFLPSLIIWLIGKDRGPRVATEGKEALNWQITFTIAYVALWIVTSILSAIVFFLALFLWLLPLALWVLNVVWSIQGGMKVNAGGSFRYPWNLRLIK